MFLEYNNYMFLGVATCVFPEQLTSQASRNRRLTYRDGCGKPCPPLRAPRQPRPHRIWGVHSHGRRKCDRFLVCNCLFVFGGWGIRKAIHPIRCLTFRLRSCARIQGGRGVWHHPQDSFSICPRKCPNVLDGRSSLLWLLASFGCTWGHQFINDFAVFFGATQILLYKKDTHQLIYIQQHYIQYTFTPCPSLLQASLCQECAESRRVLCTSVVLDRGPEELVQRLSNKVYDMCRANALTLVGFPVFGPVVAAIQEARVETPSTQFQVTVKKHDRLVILQSLAEKWMTTEFKDATVQEVEAHNQKFNKGGEYWHQEEQRPGVNMLTHWVMLEITSNLQTKPKLFTVVPFPCGFFTSHVPPQSPPMCQLSPGTQMRALGLWSESGWRRPRLWRKRMLWICRSRNSKLQRDTSGGKISNMLSLPKHGFVLIMAFTRMRLSLLVATLRLVYRSHPWSGSLPQRLNKTFFPNPWLASFILCSPNP